MTYIFVHEMKTVGTVLLGVDVFIIITSSLNVVNVQVIFSNSNITFHRQINRYVGIVTSALQYEA